MIDKSPVVDVKATGARDTQPGGTASACGLGALTWWLAGAEASTHIRNRHTCGMHGAPKNQTRQNETRTGSLRSGVSLAREASRTWPQATGKADVLLALDAGGCVHRASCARLGASLSAASRTSHLVRLYGWGLAAPLRSD